MRVVRLILKYCLEFLVVAPAGVGLCLLASTVWPAIDVHLRLLAFLFLSWRVYCVVQYHLAWTYSVWKHLNALVTSGLFSSSWLRQHRAINILSAVAGNRFGIHLSPRRHAKTVSYWRRWWKRNEGSPKWDPVVGKYVT